MGMIENELKEITRLREEYKAGKINDRQVDTLVKLLNQSEKRHKSILMAHMSVAKIGKVGFNRLARTNLIGNGTAIDIGGDPELEKVKCPDQGDDLITRAECLEYSGDAEHMDGCKTCDHFSVTRTLLLGPKKTTT